ncbi:MAG TPA: nicotinate (nicotinamide) nucleotide adenylyltransferase [Verrucomicrobiota bacterium]|nr:nicotinate (nicotinamide) nucleotide adenylyltransferase [Verrucomicrobiota bacterium]
MKKAAGMVRLGIYGGSFDPIHSAHLQVAEAACNYLKLDELYFVPAARSPFKEGQSTAPAALRLKWVQLALEGHPEWKIDSSELERGGISYTIETVKKYRKRFPDAELFYLIGMDNVPSLPKWKDAQELARLVEFAVVSRPGESFVPLPEVFRMHLIDNVFCETSSRGIRERIALGQSVEGLMPAAVREAVLASGCYRK